VIAQRPKSIRSSSASSTRSMLRTRIEKRSDLQSTCARVERRLLRSSLLMLLCLCMGFFWTVAYCAGRP
jgi:hypothetical protein